ncbi:MAG TPA: rod-binding protein [Rhizomicrobium sp.]|jgi:Rod binding domain-containing protein|nr:rod-binding protein [Rhizomicrobium sp.]
MDAAIQSTVTMAQQGPLAPAPSRVGGSQSGNQISSTADAAKADWAAKEYESIFISQFLGSMFSGIQTDTLTGGGQGEEMFRSLMINEYGKSLEQRGGFGLAAQMKAQLLKHQEAAPQ